METKQCVNINLSRLHKMLNSARVHIKKVPEIKKFDMDSACATLDITYASAPDFPIIYKLRIEDNLQTPMAIFMYMDGNGNILSFADLDNVE